MQYFVILYVITAIFEKWTQAEASTM